MRKGSQSGWILYKTTLGKLFVALIGLGLFAIRLWRCLLPQWTVSNSKEAHHSIPVFSKSPTSGTTLLVSDGKIVLLR